MIGAAGAALGALLTLVASGQGQMTPDLKAVPPEQQVEAVRLCHGTYRLTLASGTTQTVSEFDLRLKIDSGVRGPRPGQGGARGLGARR